MKLPSRPVVLSCAVAWLVGCQAVLGIEILDSNPGSTDGGAADVSAEGPASDAPGGDSPEPVFCDPTCKTAGLARPPCKVAADGGAPTDSGDGSAPKDSGDGGAPTDTGDGGLAADGDAGSDGSPQEDAAPPAKDSLVFAVRWMRTGLNPTNANDWRTLGLDLDCLATDGKGEPASCLAQTGAGAAMQDGDEGRDNSFGNNIGAKIRLLSAGGKNIEEENNNQFKMGKQGILLVVNDYNGEPDDPSVTFTLLMAGSTVDGSGVHAQPAWDGQDIWTVDKTSFSELTQEPIVIDKHAYVAGRVLVATLPDGLPITIRAETSDVVLQLRSTTITMALNAELSVVESGVIAGVWPKTFAEQSMSGLLGGLKVCPGSPGWDMVKTMISGAVDIRNDGVAAPDLECQGISIGFGFMAVKAVRGSIVDAPPPKTDPCLDAGTDAAKDSAK